MSFWSYIRWCPRFFFTVNRPIYYLDPYFTVSLSIILLKIKNRHQPAAVERGVQPLIALSSNGFITFGAQKQPCGLFSISLTANSLEETVQGSNQTGGSSWVRTAFIETPRNTLVHFYIRLWVGFLPFVYSFLQMSLSKWDSCIIAQSPRQIDTLILQAKGSLNCVR